MLCNLVLKRQMLCTQARAIKSKFLKISKMAFLFICLLLVYLCLQQFNNSTTLEPKTKQLCSLLFLSSKSKQLCLAFFFVPKTEQLCSLQCSFRPKPNNYPWPSFFHQKQNNYDLQWSFRPNPNNFITYSIHITLRLELFSTHS